MTHIHLARYDSAPVCEIARSSGPAHDELMRLAMGDRKAWTLPDWQRKLVELDACNDPVGEWRMFREP